MELRFMDTIEGREQDYLCALLMSLSMMSDCYERSRGSDGVNRNNLYQEMKFHHQMAIKTALRLLGCTAHNVTIASTENIQMISDAVSYTHLDVYKRQLWKQSLHRMDSAP